VNHGVVARAPLVAVSLATLALAAPAGAAPTLRHAEIWLFQGAEPVAVPRAAPGIPALVRSLLAGPTRRERRRGLSSAIPPGTVVNELRIERRVVTVDLGARFAAGRNEASLRARVGQLVRTLRAVPGVLGVRVRIEGGVPIGLFPGYDLRRTVRDPLPEAAFPGPRQTEQLLADLGFMAPTGVGGRLDDETATAVLAFEKWAGLPRDGIVDADVTAALRRTTRPQPVLRRPGRRVELLLRRQVALQVVDNRVERVFHVSSGSGGATPTGSFRVYRKERLSWSIPFSTWMPWASYFVGGIALHEYWPVPAYPASHGCVRMTARDAPLLYAFATRGTPVDVLWERP
jgi:L,D-transpeptidase catalytic domain/Sporulation and spore germination/Putative peptidoglycan binding domain